MRISVLSLLTGIALIGVTAIAHAVPIANNSQIDITGGVAALPNGPVDAATGLDFLNHGVAGTPGGTISLNAAPTGSFSSLTLAACPLSASAGGCGTIQDLPIGSLVVGSLPVLGFFSITEGGITATFNLLALTNVTRVSAGLTSLSVSGTGIFDLTGFDPTPGLFTLTTQGSGQTTFSLSSLAIPEPASLAVMGIGLLGLGLVARWRG